MISLKQCRLLEHLQGELKIEINTCFPKQEFLFIFLDLHSEEQVQNIIKLKT